MQNNQDQKPKPKLTLVSQPTEYFKDLIDSALDKHKVKTEPHTEFYLVNLLSQFIRAENLFEVDAQSGNLREQALAHIFAQAMSAVDFITRQRQLQKLGDVSLYRAGFFSDSLARKIVDVDYYIDMGKRAYSNLSTLTPDQELSRLFAELSDRFHKFVDVLAEISEHTAVNNAKQNILRLYELWLKTKSEKAAQQLKDAGIIPTATIKTGSSH